MNGGRATLDFFEAQANARRRTRLLVFSFAVAIALVTAFVYAGALAVDTAVAPEHALRVLAGTAHGFAWFRPGLLAATLLSVSSVVGLGGAWHGSQLAAGGGEAVARLLGGRRVEPGAQEPLERRLVDVTEEMAVAAGIPVPALFVLDREEAINAFAAGFTVGHSVVAVTRGALTRLDRDELQGVVAHELSHVLNHDTRIDLQLMAVVGGLGILTAAGRVLLRQLVWESGSSVRRRSSPLAPLGLALLLAGAFGALCGALVRYAVARQREWLADASAVQFTRNPDGLAGALQKIAAEGSTVLAAFAPEAAHLFFASPTSGFFESLFSTHPPIEERIRRIAPRLAGGRERRVAAVAPTARRPEAAALSAGGGGPRPAGVGTAGLAGAGYAAAGGAAPPPVRAAGLVGAEAAVLPPGDAAVPPAGRAGAPARPDETGAAANGGSPVADAASLIGRLPAALTAAAREPLGARALACALLLDGSEAVRAEQGAYLGRNDPALGAAVEELAPSLGGVGRVERMALVALALPALDRLSEAQGRALSADLRALAGADGAVTPFELALERVVQRRLVRDAGSPPRPVLRSVDEAGPECLELLANLAWTGGRDAAAAQAALDAGARALGATGTWQLPARERLGLGRLDVALTRLDEASPQVKGTLLAACAATALADGQVTLDEAELVRAAAAALGQPMPRLVT